jgi:signal transduction histidine kinase
MKTEGYTNLNNLFKAYIRDQAATEATFDALALLAAGMAGMSVCLINLVDIDLQLTIGSFGILKHQVLPAESICQYTVLQDVPFEVKELALDPRFESFTNLKHFGIKYYYGIPLFAASGLKIGTFCVMDQRDLPLNEDKKSALKLIAEQISGRLEDFRLLNEMQNRLAAAEKRQALLAHDIRGPLVGISALSELAMDDLGSDNKRDLPLYLRHIKESGYSLLDLADGILAGGKPVESKVFSTELSHLILQLQKLFAPNAIKKRIHLSISGSNATVNLPGTELLQAMANLVGNAIKFTTAQGAVTVEILTSATELTVLVTDTGIGMSEAQLARLFLTEGSSTLGTAGEKGSGLGLAAVYNFAKTHKGQLTATSVEGQGSCFKLTLPNCCNYENPERITLAEAS